MKAPSFIRRRFESILTQKDIPVNFLYSSYPSLNPLPENKGVKRGQIYFFAEMTPWNVKQNGRCPCFPPISLAWV